jgi:hypothetical protein
MNNSIIGITLKNVEFADGALLISLLDRATEDRLAGHTFECGLDFHAAKRLATH